MVNGRFSLPWWVVEAHRGGGDRSFVFLWEASARFVALAVTDGLSVYLWLIAGRAAANLNCVF